MEDKVLIIKQMQELIALGINVSKASMYWLTSSKIPTWTPKLKLYTKDLKEGDHVIGIVPIPTFTLQDILEMLPEDWYNDNNCDEFKLRIWHDYKNDWCMAYEPDGFYTLNPSLLQAAFNMLKWCKENGYI